MAVQLAFCAIDFGTTTGFNTVIAIATEGFCAFESAMTRKKFLTPFVLHRFVLRRTSGRPNIEQANWSLPDARRTVYAWEILPTVQCDRILVSSVRFNYVQLPARYDGLKLYMHHELGD